MEEEISDGTTVIVNVNDLVSRAEVDLGLEQLLMEDFSDQRLMRPDKHVTLAAGISEYWHTKEFSDVEIICGLDGISVRAHKIVLAGISPLFKSALQEESDYCAHDKTTIMLPDIDSELLNDFLSNVYLGCSDVAILDSSLDYLQFKGSFLTAMKKSDNIPIEILVASDNDQIYPVTHDLPQTENDNEQRKVAIWSFFEIVGATQAKCLECEMIVEISNENISFLESHLFLHNNLYEEFQSAVKNLLQETVQKRPSKRKSLGWNFFRKSNDSTAICSICGTVIKTEGSNTTGILRHLKRCHEDVSAEHIDFNFEDATDLNEIPLAPTSIFEHGGDPNPPNIWRFFQRQRQQFASCYHCDADIKFYKEDFSSLEKHMITHHLELWEENGPLIEDRKVDLENIKAENDSDKSIYVVGDSMVRQRNIVSNFFRKEGKSSICTICDLPVKGSSGNISSMARHVRRAHPDDYAKISSNILEKESDLGNFGKQTDKFDVASFFETLEQEHMETSNNGVEIISNESQITALCRICKESITCSSTDTSKLEQHWREKHKVEGRLPKRKKSNRSAVWTFFDKTEKKTESLCRICNSILVCSKQNTTTMIRHLQRKHSAQYLEYVKESGIEVSPKKNSEQSTRKVPVSTKDLNHRTCVDCGKVFWHRRAMIYHRKIVHSGIRPYNCDVCGASFARLECFQKHHHQRDKTYLCSICGKTFGAKSARDLHERAHRGDKRYQCRTCGKSFMTNQGREKHERIHTGEKPFSCSDCGRSFTQEHQLKTHIRIHTGEKPYSCDFCEQRFRHLSSKSKHRCEARNIGFKWTTEELTTQELHEEEALDSE